MTMKNDAKFEEELTCRFKIHMRNSTNFDPSTQKEELCLMAMKIDAKFEGKLTCACQNDTRNLANFHRLKNSDFILESKMTKLNQNKNSKQLGRPDAVRKPYFTWK